jgi:hypothetical protein
MKVQHLVPALLIGAIGVAGAGVVGAAPGEDAHRVLAVFPPQWAAGRAFLAASGVGAVVTVGPSPTILVIQSSTAELARRTSASGAWLVLDAGAMSGCSARSTEPRS